MPQNPNSNWYSLKHGTQWRHKSKISENLGRCGRQNMLWPHLKIWDWDWIFGRAVKAISCLGVRSLCFKMYGKLCFLYKNWWPGSCRDQWQNLLEYLTIYLATLPKLDQNICDIIKQKPLSSVRNPWLTANSVSTS